MDNTQPTQPSPPSTPVPPTPAPVTTPPAHSSIKTSPLIYAFLLLMLILGILLGYGLFQFSPAATTPPTPKTEIIAESKITLPKDAVQIQACANNKGTLYVKPKDIPVGPVYMVNSGRVIGIEFMLGKDEFLQGQSYKYLSGLGAKINHVNIGLLSEGHEGYTVPHYHIDMYLVSKEVAENIKCPSVSPTATPSGTITPVISPATTSSPLTPTKSLLP